MAKLFVAASVSIRSGIQSLVRGAFMMLAKGESTFGKRIVGKESREVDVPVFRRGT
jgi:hypothetical protein